MYSLMGAVQSVFQQRFWAPRNSEEAAAYHIVGGTTPRVTASMSIPADNNSLSIGDAISNSASGASVTPLEFIMPRRSGRITGCQCVVTPATGNLVRTNLDFDLLLFLSDTDLPFAAGSYPAHNAAMVITPAAFRKTVGVFRFVNGSWRGGDGTLSNNTATAYQSAAPNSARPFMTFDLDGMADTTKLRAVVQAQAAWNAANVINTLDFSLDVDLD